MDRDKRLDELQQKLGLSFFNKTLLSQSLTHSSFANEANVPDNERLEFLGDAVIKLAISEYLFNKFPTRPEGDLTKIRAAVISDDTLAKIAEKINLGEYLSISENERAGGGARRKSNIANAFEALIGAMYLDAGIGKSRDFLVHHLSSEIETVSQVGYIVDFKSTLQEFAQKRKWELPRYIVLSETGPRHNKTFNIGVKIRGRILGKGSGPNKKEAEQKAATQALAVLKKKEEGVAARVKGIVKKVTKTKWIF
ncbi:ribonuclease III [candidate division WOR-1 bacterium RIFOXYA12_FULL_43_27]|uniref:Ribonuclease 3 n=1 Tax=candidate division WOR-1 bacterium RIFOXYC2_FULL_46_14 TaxID=1802587 RepID=A0A1F4U4Z2_UNCSA|nr:MAG: ribonuclease III [candidate division WOR-1 bacterium RIFOXYA12_FULL_43_27]OGC20666.1 MAG: ribonuclease III [candidate division WOR-1 bacterium RIFOXYB2_FULL_46_45]OGC31597.1 MAG: ribonuclease III [candidate division WOR-1 bacterium RIFOXYA2_FULL_46_56]OGC40002.1 MAG: ribonuclease III [candidate division WOR-1 bacterium RIFOXYC2_FULL_46_14]